MESKKYIYVLETKSGIFHAEADNKKDLAKRIKINLVKIIERKRNILYKHNALCEENVGGKNDRK